MLNFTNLILPILNYNHIKENINLKLSIVNWDVIWENIIKILNDIYIYVFNTSCSTIILHLILFISFLITLYRIYETKGESGIKARKWTIKGSIIRLKELVKNPLKISFILTSLLIIIIIRFNLYSALSITEWGVYTYAYFMLSTWLPIAYIIGVLKSISFSPFNIDFSLKYVKNTITYNNAKRLMVLFICFSFLRASIIAICTLYISGLNIDYSPCLISNVSRSNSSVESDADLESNSNKTKKRKLDYDPSLEKISKKVNTGLLAIATGQGTNGGTVVEWGLGVGSYRGLSDCDKTWDTIKAENVRWCRLRISSLASLRYESGSSGSNLNIDLGSSIVENMPALTREIPTSRIHLLEWARPGGKKGMLNEPQRILITKELIDLNVPHITINANSVIPPSFLEFKEDILNEMESILEARGKFSNSMAVNLNVFKQILIAHYFELDHANGKNSISYNAILSGLIYFQSCVRTVQDVGSVDPILMELYIFPHTKPITIEDYFSVRRYLCKLEALSVLPFEIGTKNSGYIRSDNWSSHHIRKIRMQSSIIFKHIEEVNLKVYSDPVMISRIKEIKSDKNWLH